MKMNWQKFTKQAVGFVPVALLLLALAFPAQAAIVNCGNSDSNDISSGCKFSDLFTSAANLVNYLLSGAAVIAVGGVVYGGYLLVTSAGNQARQGSGKKAVTNSMIGLAIILIAFLGVKSLFSILGFKGANPLENPTGGGFNLVGGGGGFTDGSNGSNGGGTDGGNSNAGSNSGRVLPPTGTAQEIAKRILASPGAQCFQNVHASGHTPNGDTARDNITDTANGLAAKRSSYDGAPGGSVALDERMLSALEVVLGKYSSACSISSLAGSKHSVDDSKHYTGKAFDIADESNSAGIVAICKQYGATDAGIHSNNHIHCSWP